jgi:hypothetical protein
MPFKANAARRHHIPKQKRKVTNWADYNASLRQRGSLTLSGQFNALYCRLGGAVGFMQRISS